MANESKHLTPEQIIEIRKFALTAAVEWSASNNMPNGQSIRDTAEWWTKWLLDGVSE